jgi:hypothetical protein
MTYYSATGAPYAYSRGRSDQIEAEFKLVEAGFTAAANDIGTSVVGFPAIIPPRFKATGGDDTAALTTWIRTAWQAGRPAIVAANQKIQIGIPGVGTPSADAQTPGSGGSPGVAINVDGSYANSSFLMAFEDGCTVQGAQGQQGTLFQPERPDLRDQACPASSATCCSTAASWMRCEVRGWDVLHLTTWATWYMEHVRVRNGPNYTTNDLGSTLGAGADAGFFGTCQYEGHAVDCELAGARDAAVYASANPGASNFGLNSHQHYDKCRFVNAKTAGIGKRNMAVLEFSDCFVNMCQTGIRRRHRNARTMASSA